MPLANGVKSYSPDYRAPRAGKHRVSALTQALDLRDVAYKDASNPETPPHIKAAIMRAWVDLQELALALKGHGKPKLVEARNAAPKRKSVNATPVVYPQPGEASGGAR